MIERHWKGVAKSTSDATYIKHLREETFPLLSHIEGFKKAKILKRNTDQGVEFLIITTWESLDVIKKFAGENVTTAVVPLKVKEMMVRFDESCVHYEMEGDYNLPGDLLSL